MIPLGSKKNDNANKLNKRFKKRIFSKKTYLSIAWKICRKLFVAMLVESPIAKNIKLYILIFGFKKLKTKNANIDDTKIIKIDTKM